MAFQQKTIGEFTLGTVINDADLLPYEQGGVTKRIPFEALKANVPNFGHDYQEFDNSDLSGNVLTINHAKSTLLVELKIYNPAGIRQYIPYTVIDTDNISVDFGGVIDAGTWTYEFNYIGGTNAGYPDPIYEPAITKGDLVLDTTSKNAALTIESFTAYQYGNIAFVAMAIRSTTVFLEAGAGAVVGKLPITCSGLSFPGSITDVPFYETAFGDITNAGIIKIYCGKANKKYVFNFTTIII